MEENNLQIELYYGKRQMICGECIVKWTPYTGAMETF